MANKLVEIHGGNALPSSRLAYDTNIGLARLFHVYTMSFHSDLGTWTEA